METALNFLDSFYGDDPYPFTLDMVEKRDPTNLQTAFLINVFRNSQDPIVDFGAGNGRHAFRLANLERKVIAIDIVRFNCLSMGRRNGYAHLKNSLYIICANYARTPLRDCSVGGIYCFYASFGYSSDIDFQMFKEAFRILRPSAFLVLDQPNIKNLSNKSLNLDYEYSSNFFSLIIQTLSDKQIITRRYIVLKRNKFPKCYMLKYKIYNITELDTKLGLIGFHKKSVYGFYDFSRYTADSKRLIYIAEKVK